MDDIKIHDFHRKGQNMNGESIGCFTAETLVYTDSKENFGLKPIEQINVGDRVLCRAEDGSGETCYKPVVKTFSYDDKEVWLVETQPLGNWVEGQGIEKIKGSGCGGLFGVTPNHPFWVVGVTSYNYSIQDFEPIAHPRWMRVDQIPENGVVIDNKGRLHVVQIARPLSKMKDSKLAWLRGGISEKWYREDDGYVYDLYRKSESYGNFELVAGGVYNGAMEQVDGSYPNYTATVYTLEVEDHHTYFVGLAGIWVHS